MPNQEPAFPWPFGNGPVRVGTQGIFCPCLKTFVAPFNPSRLTAPGSPRMGVTRHASCMLPVDLPQVDCLSAERARGQQATDHLTSRNWKRLWESVGRHVTCLLLDYIAIKTRCALLLSASFYASSRFITGAIVVNTFIRVVNTLFGSASPY